MKIKTWLILVFSLVILTYVGARLYKVLPIFYPYKVGEKVDSLNGVYVIYNGKISHVDGRNITHDGYNLGLRYQCVEFVKRYYYEYLNHKMPNSFGYAKDFYDNSIEDGQINTSRNLTQYSNPSASKPQIDDLLVLNSSSSNKFGHVAIICNVTDNEVEIIQQNTGIHGSSRGVFTLINTDGKWRIDNERILGWLRKE